jgi:hypothetical protein
MINEYLQCDQCKYFVWLPYENGRFPSPRSSQSPAKRHAVSPLRNPANFGVDDVNAAFFSALDPALSDFGHAPSQLPVALPSAQPSSSHITGIKAKTRCASKPCTRQATATCSKSMCKTCCTRDVSAVCFNKAHNKGSRPVTTSADPFHLPRPIPSVPLRLPTSTSGFDASASALSFTEPVSVSGLSVASGSEYSEPRPFYFGKPVPPALAADYNQHRQERELREQSDASRTENERRIKHTILLVAYLQRTEDPIPLPLQDIKTWPTLNLTHLPHLVAQLGLENGDNLELYIRSDHGNFWIPTLDHSMTVKTDEKVYIRQKGVHTALQPSTFSNPMAYSGSPSGSLKTPTRKRARELSPPSSRPSKIFHLDLTGDSDEFDFDGAISSPPNLEPLSLSPAPVPSQAYGLGLVTTASASESDDEIGLDRIWLSGSVVTPRALGVVWPQQIYVRDMAQAFTFLASSVGHGDLPVRFSHVFNGMPFKQSTYHLNRNFWANLPLHLRESARSLPRNPAGLWTTWRKGKPGWK